MTTPDDRPVRAGRGALLLWLGLILFCAAIVVGSRAVEAERRRHEAAERQHEAVQAELVNRFSNLWFHPQVDELVATPGRDAGKLLQPDPEAGWYRVVGGAMSPRYEGWTIRLRVSAEPSRSDYVRAARLVPPPRVRYAGPSRAWRAIEELRNSTLVFGCAAWLLAAFAFPAAGPWRRRVAQVALAGALVAGVMWCVFPFRTLDDPSLIAPLPIAIASGTLLSLIALALPLPTPRHAPGHATCAACGYDLTGNVSGICPECGLATATRRAERWRERAEQLEHTEPGAEEDAEVLVILTLDRDDAEAEEHAEIPFAPASSNVRIMAHA